MVAPLAPLHTLVTMRDIPNAGGSRATENGSITSSNAALLHRDERRDDRVDSCRICGRSQYTHMPSTIACR